MNWQRPGNLNNASQAVFDYTSVSTSRSLTLVKPSLPSYRGNRFTSIHVPTWGGELRERGLGPPLPVRPRQALGHKAPRGTRRPLNRKRLNTGGTGEAARGASSRRRTCQSSAQRRGGPGRARSALRARPPAAACPGPPLTAEGQAAPRPATPTLPRAHPEDEVQEDQDGFGGGDAALPHGARRPSASRRSAPSAPPPAPPHVTQAAARRA